MVDARSLRPAKLRVMMVGLLVRCGDDDGLLWNDVKAAGAVCKILLVMLCL